MLGNIKQKINQEKFVFDKVEFWDWMSPDFLDRYSLYKLINEKLKKYIVGDVLDFGCGSKPYAKLFECNKYIGIDTSNSGHWDSEDCIGPDVLYDGTILPFESESYDTVFSTQVFEHVPDIEMSVKEIKRVLKLGGVLVITVPMAEEEHEIPYDFRRYTQYGIEHFLKTNGFEIIESGKVNGWRYSMVILKIAQICNSKKPTILKILRVWRLTFYGRCIKNKDEGFDCKFSNKVYCVAKKAEV